MDIIVQHELCVSDTNVMVLGEYMIAIFKQSNDKYGVFDSHSRNNRGLLAENGSAVLLYFSNIQNLISHLRN